MLNAFLEIVSNVPVSDHGTETRDTRLVYNIAQLIIKKIVIVC